MDKTEIAELNQSYLDHQGPTDVITFDYREDADALPPDDDDDIPTLGEVIICPEMAEEAAPEHHLTFAEEVVLYAVHGFLHLAGYDDHELEQRQTMRAAERRVMDQLLKDFSLTSIFISGPSALSPSDEAHGRSEP